MLKNQFINFYYYSNVTNNIIKNYITLIIFIGFILKCIILIH